MSRATLHARFWSPEEGRRNVESWHDIFGSEETARRIKLDRDSAVAWRAIEASCLAMRSLATRRGERWSWTYQARRAARRAAYYDARVEAAAAILAREIERL